MASFSSMAAVLGQLVFWGEVRPLAGGCDDSFQPPVVIEILSPVTLSSLLT